MDDWYNSGTIGKIGDEAGLKNDNISFKSSMGVSKVLVSFPDFKSGVAYHKWAGWVRFPHAPAI